MDGKLLSDELQRVCGALGSRPVFVVREGGSRRFVIVRVAIDIEARGGPVLLFVASESDMDLGK